MILYLIPKDQMSSLNNQQEPVPMFTPLRDYQRHQEEYDQAISQVLNHGRFINGPEISQLEEQLQKYLGQTDLNAICVSSGTDALMVALMALDLKPEDEVITVAHTWISTAEVISVLGAKPVFCDIKADTFLMDLAKVPELITPKTKGIIYVSLYGQSEHPSKIRTLAKEHNLWVIEDGAQSFGAVSSDGIKSCTWADISCSSFFPSKPLGCYGDGGACFSNNTNLSDKIRAIKSHGGLERFNHQYIGLNARLDTIQASILLVKLKYFKQQNLNRRREIADYYTQAILTHQQQQEQTNRKIKLNPPIKVDNGQPAWAQYSILLTDNQTDLTTKELRDQIVEELKNRGIQVAIFYPKGLHQQPCFNNNQNLAVTDLVCDSILNLPLFAELEPTELEKITTILFNIVDSL